MDNTKSDAECSAACDCSTATVPSPERMQSLVQSLQEKYESEFMQATEHYRKSRCEVATKILDERVAVLSRAMDDLTVLWEQSMGFRN